MREGQIVRRGDRLGRCGASGRAPEPHLHLQFQATPRIGAPTIEGELHDVMIAHDGEDEGLAGTTVPDEDDVIRNLEATPDVAKRFDFVPGRSLRFEVATGSHGTRRHEAVEPAVDLHGNLLLRSRRSNATLYYAKDDRMFTVYDAVGDRRSVLHVIRAALSRVVFEAKDGFEWTDVLPLRAVSALPIRVLLDFVAPFVARAGLEMRYTARERDDRLIIEGRSVRKDRQGRPLVSTEAVLDGGIEQVELTVRGVKTTARRSAEERTRHERHRHTDPHGRDARGAAVGASLSGVLRARSRQ